MKIILSKMLRILFISALAMLLISFIPARAQQAAEKEPNNEIAQANPLPLNGQVSGFANEENDEDWFQLNIAQSGLDILTVEITAVPGVNLRLALLDADANELNYVDANEESRKQKITRIMPKPGDTISECRQRAGPMRMPLTRCAREEPRHLRLPQRMSARR